MFGLTLLIFIARSLEVVVMELFLLYKYIHTQVFTVKVIFLTNMPKHLQTNIGSYIINRKKNPWIL